MVCERNLQRERCGNHCNRHCAQSRDYETAYNFKCLPRQTWNKRIFCRLFRSSIPIKIFMPPLEIDIEFSWKTVNDMSLIRHNWTCIIHVCVYVCVCVCVYVCALRAINASLNYYLLNYPLTKRAQTRTFLQKSRGKIVYLTSLCFVYRSDR